MYWFNVVINNYYFTHLICSHAPHTDNPWKQTKVSEFVKVREESMDLLEKEEMSSSMEDNVYRYNLLTGHYLSLFPLRSGIFLINMEKYATKSKKKKKKNTQANSIRHKNRNANSYECSFGILKNFILQRRRNWGQQNSSAHFIHLYKNATRNTWLDMIGQFDPNVQKQKEKKKAAKQQS